MNEITEADIEWEKIENPDPSGPYWQPKNPYARYFWRELIETVRHMREREIYRQTSEHQLAEYFKKRLSGEL